MTRLYISQFCYFFKKTLNNDKISQLQEARVQLTYTPFITEGGWMVNK